MNQRSAPYLQYILFAAFSLSGFSGLIYESIWTNYLKFFLGHAAYAQALVLAMFMGGMAGGAWLAGRYVPRMRSPLIGYAVVEVVIGLFGLLFHEMFIATNSFVFDVILPGVDSPQAIEMVRWTFAACLILPQTLLLGATFPLMSIGILRAFPNAPGSSISMLYFTNSIGAVAGVLTSGFFLIGLVGLPGTIMTAGLVNFLLAFVVYGIQKKLSLSAIPERSATGSATPLLRPMLLVALITGMASFIYEISWIRMLSIVTGASTHAFELMLSAFILGLALGGLWLRKRIDTYKEPLIALGVIQLLMGLLAIGTVLGYNQLMELMSVVFRALKPSEAGYFMFNTGSQLAAMALMLPATFMAGMTLPLITLVLFRGGAGESALGKVYAFNTLGAILGVVLASMFLLPAFGLKMAVLIGATLDMALALYLLTRGGAAIQPRAAAWAVVLVAVVGTYLAPAFDASRMASGIFRMRGVVDPTRLANLLHVDGRTASVDVVRSSDGTLILSTNGKVDASYMPGNGPPSGDEPTMVLLGALPLLIKPDAQNAAVIGMGAGMSADVLLTSKSLKRLDVIEIEEAMIDGARIFGKASARVFTDPRSHIHIDDAKSYFAAHKMRYDLIVSEPSDTWVSGVSSLFTDEFYRRMRKHLKDDGVLVQWIANYTSSPDLIASKMQALGKSFSDYRIYAATDAVMVVIATATGKLPELDPAAMNNPELVAEMTRVGWKTIDDVHLHEIGRRDFIEPLFTYSQIPVNSDFFPYVDQNAHKARILDVPFNNLTTLHQSGLPFPGANFDGKMVDSFGGYTGHYGMRTRTRIASDAVRYLGDPSGQQKMGIYGYAILTALRSKPNCNDQDAQNGWYIELVRLATLTLPHTSAETAAPMLAQLRGQLCDTAHAQKNRNMLDLMDAVAARNMPAVEKAASVVLGGGVPEAGARTYATEALLLSLYHQQKWYAVQRIAAGMPPGKSALANIIEAHALVNLSKPQ